MCMGCFVARLIGRLTTPSIPIISSRLRQLSNMREYIAKLHREVASFERHLKEYKELVSEIEQATAAGEVLSHDVKARAELMRSGLIVHGHDLADEVEQTFCDAERVRQEAEQTFHESEEEMKVVHALRLRMLAKWSIR